MFLSVAHQFTLTLGFILHAHSRLPVFFGFPKQAQLLLPQDHEGEAYHPETLLQAIV